MVPFTASKSAAPVIQDISQIPVMQFTRHTLHLYISGLVFCTKGPLLYLFHPTSHLIIESMYSNPI